MSGVSSPEKSLQKTKVPDSVIRVLRLLGDYEDALANLTDEEVAGWPDSVVRIMRHKARGPEVKHPAVFPVALPTEIMRAYSEPGNVVFEPFCGAGSSIIACEQHGRRCFGMEIEPLYVDIAVRRWEAFTGLSATLESDGRTFADVATFRLSANPSAMSDKLSAA
jgi:DNA modification methylase